MAVANDHPVRTRQGPHLTWKKPFPTASGFGNQTRCEPATAERQIFSCAASSEGWPAGFRGERSCEFQEDFPVGTCFHTRHT